jgi:hypothetical protein
VDEPGVSDDDTPSPAHERGLDFNSSQFGVIFSSDEMQKVNQSTMSPLRIRRVNEEDYPPTWNVLSTVGGTVWFSYVLYSSALSIWTWLVQKVEKLSRRPATDVEHVIVGHPHIREF